MRFCLFAVAAVYSFEAARSRACATRTAGWRLDTSVTVNDVSAAERRKNVAPGASPVYALEGDAQPRRGERCAPWLSPLRGWVQHEHEPRAAPGATFLRRSAATVDSVIPGSDFGCGFYRAFTFPARAYNPLFCPPCRR